MAVAIEKPRRQFRQEDGTVGAVFDIHVDSVDDLPELGSLLDGMAVCRDSIAADKTGIWYKLAADGKWYIQDGSGDAAGDEPQPNTLNMAPRTVEPIPDDALTRSDADDIGLGEEQPETPFGGGRNILTWDDDAEPEPDGGDMR